MNALMAGHRHDLRQQQVAGHLSGWAQRSIWIQAVNLLLTCVTGGGFRTESSM